MKTEASTWKNQLYFGDNLDILRELSDEMVDLIYLDPPFNSQATYNVLFGEKNGARSQAQITAFEDTWEWGEESREIYHELVTQGPKKLADLIQAFRSFLGQNNMMAYVVMMAARLAELHRILKPTGSIYLHCDPTASHYLKLTMDAIFGFRSFLNEIIWKRRTGFMGTYNKFGVITDSLFLYTKGDRYTFNRQGTPNKLEYLGRFNQRDETGRLYRLADITRSIGSRPNLMYTYKGFPPPPHGWAVSREKMEQMDAEGRLYLPIDKSKRIQRKRFLDELEGKPVQSLWDDIFPINPQARERLGYPTQKPEALLERIVNASSNPGDLVLDPFCGCGTTINVAERLRRRWIGIDITHLAIALIRNRLHDTFGPELSPYEVIGAPRDVASARALAQDTGKNARYQFEWWALSLMDARPAQDKKKGADTGIDGYINFFDDESGVAKKIVVQVKSGHVTASQIRDLKAVVEREKAVIGAFVTLEPPTKSMIQEALAAEFYQPERLSRADRVPKIQILTIEELLSGASLKYPRLATATFKKAKRKYKDDGTEQPELGNDGKTLTDEELL